jgi:hypothetical protein
MDNECIKVDNQRINMHAACGFQDGGVNGFVTVDRPLVQAPAKTPAAVTE